MHLLFKGWEQETVNHKPSAAWDTFEARVRRSVEESGETWDTVKGMPGPWVYIRQLQDAYRVPQGAVQGAQEGWDRRQGQVQERPQGQGQGQGQGRRRGDGEVGADEGTKYGDSGKVVFPVTVDYRPPTMQWEDDDENATATVTMAAVATPTKAETPRKTKKKAGSGRKSRKAAATKSATAVEGIKKAVSIGVMAASDKKLQIMFKLAKDQATKWIEGLQREAAAASKVGGSNGSGNVSIDGKIGSSGGGRSGSDKGGEGAVVEPPSRKVLNALVEKDRSDLDGWFARILRHCAEGKSAAALSGSESGTKLSGTLHQKWEQLSILCVERLAAAGAAGGGGGGEGGAGGVGRKAGRRRLGTELEVSLLKYSASSHGLLS